MQPTKPTSLQSADFAQTSMNEAWAEIFPKTGKKRETINNVWKAQVVDDDNPRGRIARRDLKGYVNISLFTDDQSILVEPNRLVS